MKPEPGNGLNRKTLLSGLGAIFLLGIFVLVNYYRLFQDTHQPIESQGEVIREQLPPGLQGRGETLAAHDFESGNAADTASHLAGTGHGSRQSLKLSSKIPFSPGLWIKFKDLLPGDSAWLRATGYVWFSCPAADARCSLVATCNHNGINYKYMSVPVEKEAVKPNQWNKICIDYRIPPPPGREDILQVYFWYRGSGEMLVDDIVVNIYKGLKK